MSRLISALLLLAWQQSAFAAWAVGNIGAPAYDTDTNVTCVIPTHAAGDVLIAFATHRTNTDYTVAASGSWSELHEFRSSAVYALVAASSSETDPTITWSGSSGNAQGCVVFTLTGGPATLVGIVEGTIGEQFTASGTAIDFDAISIDDDGVIVLDFAGIQGQRTVTPTASPAFTQIVDELTNIGAGTPVGTTLFVQALIQTSAANVAARSATLNSGTQNESISIALLPGVADSPAARVLLSSPRRIPPLRDLR